MVREIAPPSEEVKQIGCEIISHSMEIEHYTIEIDSHCREINNCYTAKKLWKHAEKKTL